MELHNRTLAARRWRSEAILRLCSSKTSAFNAVVLRRPRLDVRTQEHVEKPKRTGGTGARDLGSTGTPEYIKMKASKINPLRTVPVTYSRHRCRKRERGGGVGVLSFERE